MDELCFDSLPNEVVAHVFDFLPLCDKKKARLVCHRWRFIADNCYTRKSFEFRPILTNRSAKHFFNSYQQNMDQVVMKNLTNRMPKLTSTHNLFPRIKNCILGWKNTEGKIVKFLKHGCEYSDSLTVTKFSLEKIREKVLSETLAEIEWNTLKRLNISVVLSKYKFEKASKHLESSITFLKFAKIQNLQTFEFKFLHQYDNYSAVRQERFQNVCLQFFAFLASHAKSLKDLMCTIGTNNQRRYKLPEIPEALKISICSSLRLQSCIIRIWGTQNFENLVCPHLLGSDLRKFGLYTTWRDIGDFNIPDAQVDVHLLNNRLGQIFEANSDKLMEISLNVSVMDISWLRNCYSLKYLKLLARNYLFQSEVDLVLPQLNMTSFIYGSYQFPPAIRQLVQNNRRTFTTLRIGAFNDTLFEGPNRFWLEEFVALKFLRIFCLDMNFIAQCNPHAVFPNLTELLIDLLGNDQRSTVEWITRSMPNLEVFANYGPHTPLFVIKTILRLGKIKSIGFHSQFVSEAIIRYCVYTPGLVLKISRLREGLGYHKFSISVNQSIFSTSHN